jgi:hypothetical protein
VTLGTLNKVTYAHEQVISNDNAPTKDAQVETQMLVRLQSAVTQRPFSFRFGTADYTAFNYATYPAGDQVIIAGAGASAATTALINAIQAVVIDPVTGEAAEVVGIEVVR